MDEMLRSPKAESVETVRSGLPPPPPPPTTLIGALGAAKTSWELTMPA